MVQELLYENHRLRCALEECARAVGGHASFFDRKLAGAATNVVVDGVPDRVVHVVLARSKSGPSRFYVEVDGAPISVGSLDVRVDPASSLFKCSFRLDKDIFE